LSLAHLEKIVGADPLLPVVAEKGGRSHRKKKKRERPSSMFSKKEANGPLPAGPGRNRKKGERRATFPRFWVQAPRRGKESSASMMWGGGERALTASWRPERGPARKGAGRDDLAGQKVERGEEDAVAAKTRSGWHQKKKKGDLCSGAKPSEEKKTPRERKGELTPLPG